MGIFIGGHAMAIAEDVDSPSNGHNSRGLLNFVGSVDDQRVKDARKNVNLAMKNSSMALRLDFIVKKYMKEGSKMVQTGDAKVLPPCINKYEMLGRERFAIMIHHLAPRLTIELLRLMRLDDLKLLMDFAILARRPCAFTHFESVGRMQE